MSRHQAWVQTGHHRGRCEWRVGPSPPGLVPACLHSPAAPLPAVGPVGGAGTVPEDRLTPPSPSQEPEAERPGRAEPQPGGWRAGRGPAALPALPGGPVPGSRRRRPPGAGQATCPGEPRDPRVGVVTLAALCSGCFVVQAHTQDVSCACDPSGLSPRVPGEWGAGWKDRAPPRPLEGLCAPLSSCAPRQLSVGTPPSGRPVCQLSGPRVGVPSAAGPVCSGALWDSKPMEKNSLQTHRAVSLPSGWERRCAFMTAG